MNLNLPTCEPLGGPSDHDECPPTQCKRPAHSLHRDGSAQRTRDIENLRVTIKILERQDREIELETARLFLREMKNKERKPLVPNVPDQRPAGSALSHPPCSGREWPIPGAPFDEPFSMEEGDVALHLAVRDVTQNEKLTGRREENL